MKINKEIVKIFKEHNIFFDDGICYLISIYYNYKPTYIPENLKTEINNTNIITTKNNKTYWNISLFDNQEDDFSWVKTQYVKMFKDANITKGGNIRESTLRMKKLFNQNPQLTKKDVLIATEMYLKNTNPKYIRYPHYFIEKGMGNNKISDILTWLDIVQSVKEKQKGRISLTNTLQ